MDRRSTFFLLPSPWRCDTKPQIGTRLGGLYHDDRVIFSGYFKLDKLEVCASVIVRGLHIISELLEDLIFFSCSYASFDSCGEGNTIIKFRVLAKGVCLVKGNFRAYSLC